MSRRLHVHIKISNDGGASEWPNGSLDIEGLLPNSWRPTPFRQFIIKLHSRCNLSCTYCYVYKSADQSWRSRPGRMPDSTIRRAVERIAEHVQTHGLHHIDIVLHGGEPLLAGTKAIDLVTRSLRDALPGRATADVTIVTNGTLLDEAALDAFRRHGIRVAVSLDGDAKGQDARRVYADGRGSYEDVSRALRLLGAEGNRHLFAGILGVIDPLTDPVGVYEHLLQYEPPAIDFLLPLANWSSPPHRPGSSATPHGDWLVRLFDRWYYAPQRETSIRLFDELIGIAFGRASHVESIGLTPVGLVVVETDGSIEQVDTLKSTYAGAAATGLHVEHDSFDAALGHPMIMARQLGLDALPDACRACDVVEICGGGYYPHRFRLDEGFRNRSVYCADLMLLIRHVLQALHADLHPTVVEG